MVRNKMYIALFIVLLVNHQSTGVINTGNSPPSLSDEFNKNGTIEVDKRVDNLYKLPANDYGTPSDSNLKELSPVYGPPELTGDYRPPPIYDSPPPEQPPPLPQVSSSQLFPPYNPLNNIKPQYVPPKSTFKPLPSLINQNYGSPKPQYGPPKSNYGAPLSALRPPKPQYGLPPKYHGPSALQYGLPHGNSGKFSSNYDLPIPMSIEAYGPPKKEAFESFASISEGSYKPTPTIQTPPQQQYGVPVHNDIYNPPPPPQSSIRAPPTPPDIKYDGWQPIAGHVSDSDKQPVLSDHYGPPSAASNNYRPPNTFIPPTNTYGLPLNDRGQGNDLPLGDTHSGTSLPSSNVPSDSYGTPLNNPEDHSLKSSVSQSTISHESNGLPPPALPQFEPLHNNQPSIDSSASNNIDQQHAIGSYTGPNENSLPLISTGSNVLPNEDRPIQDFHGHSGQNSLTFQQLPAITSPNYDIPVSSNPHGQLSSSISSNGLFLLSNNLRGGKLPLFNQFDFDFHKNHGNHRNRHHGVYRGPAPPYNGFIPPKRPPMKFRDSVPVKLINSLNRYTLSSKPFKIYGPPSNQNQHLSVRQNGLSFQASSNPFAPSNSFGRSNTFKLQSPLAAPNTNYGTPLSFNDFNTPAPSLTYGAPNFGPASSIGTVGNLYNNGQTNLAPTYGEFYSPDYDCNKSKDNLQYNLDNSNNDLYKVSASNQQASSNEKTEGNDVKLSANEQLNTLSASQILPNLNDVELRDYTEQQSIFKDSYGNSVANYPVYDNFPSAALNNNENIANLVSDLARANKNPLGDGSSNEGFENILAQPLSPSGTSHNHGGEEKILSESGIDPTQYIKSDEAGQALTLAQNLASDGDAFQIEGSKGTYTLQIQPSSGGYDAGNSDDAIKHEQVLSNGLLQNILSAIEEQPETKEIRLPAAPESQILDQHNEGTSSLIVRLKPDESESSSADRPQSKNLESEPRIQRNANSSEDSKVALFFYNNYNNTSKRA